MKITSLLTCLSLLLGTAFSLQNNNIVADFLEDSKSLESVNAKSPIVAMQTVAGMTAANQVTLTKDNIAEVLETAKDYKHLLIITGKHTIVKVTDLEDCKASGSWGICMPKGEGYISRGGQLEFLEDYINNIMGVPGSQNRKAYMFN